MVSFQLVIFIVALVFVYGADKINLQNNVDGLRIRFYNGSTIEQNVKFYVTSSKNRLSRHTATANELKYARGFDGSRATMLYVHGFIENSTEISVRTVMGAYLDMGVNANLLLLDWSNMAYGDYFGNAANNVAKVSFSAAKRIKRLIKSGDISPNRLHFVGHSLGCHIAGAIGRSVLKTYDKVARITCLDPAFPGFYPPFIAKAVSTSDAHFVDIIHTDAGHFGTPLPTGHVDFWPNGGYAQQPGCPFYSFIVPVTIEDFCSHRRSWHFYAESIRRPSAFPAVKCREYAKFQKAECDFSNIGYMGFTASPTLKGAYFLTTNSKFPYGRGRHGLKFISH